MRQHHNHSVTIQISFSVIYTFVTKRTESRSIIAEKISDVYNTLLLIIRLVATNFMRNNRRVVDLLAYLIILSKNPLKERFLIIETIK
jgi:hypothetical protein